MHTFEELSQLFTKEFSKEHFPQEPQTLYTPNRYFLQMGGKRVRPVLCLMANELFDEITADCWKVATAIELFHNFTLIHDDIMDKAPLRRSLPTVHEKFGSSTAILAGDVMMVAAYQSLASVSGTYLQALLNIFNQTARQVCEGQEMDMDFEQAKHVGLDAYKSMINLKTSVLLAASLKMGAITGGGLERNQNLLYEFGRKLGLAFQVQDDYLDAFGNPEKFGKQVGGDIKSNKKTFLLIHALTYGSEQQKQQLEQLHNYTGVDKVDQVLQIFESCGAKEWALELKEKYLQEALEHLGDVAVLSSRKQHLHQLACSLMQRQH